MSDYFGSLISRSLGLKEAIQPRLSSLFEPPLCSGGLMHHSLFTAVKKTPGRPWSDSVSFETPPPPPIENSLESHAQSTDPKYPHDFLQHEQTFMEPVKTPSPQPEMVNPSPLKTDRSSSPDNLDKRFSIPTKGQDETDATLGSTGQQENPPAFDPRGFQSIRNPKLIPMQITRSGKPAQVIEDPHEISLIEPAAPMSPIPVATQGTTPTIKITIGRVDVRAVMPPSPAPRPTPARSGPSLSLEDYLKQREGGRR